MLYEEPKTIQGWNRSMAALKERVEACFGNAGKSQNYQGLSENRYCITIPRDDIRHWDIWRL